MVTKHFVSDSYESLYIRVLEELDDTPEFLVTTRGQEAKEILNLSFDLTNPYDRIVWNKARATNYDFAMRFFIWMLNGCDDYDYVADVNPNAKTLIDKPDADVPKFSTAYGPRVVRQIEAIIEELKRDQGTRRAVISILHEDDLAMLGTGTKEEFPCTESISYFIRDGALHSHVKMRSNNMVTTVVYDVFNFTMLQEYVLRRLRACFPLKMGHYYHSCGSAHFFTSQQQLVINVLKSEVDPLLVRKGFISKSSGGVISNKEFYVGAITARGL